MASPEMGDARLRALLRIANFDPAGATQFPVTRSIRPTGDWRGQSQHRLVSGRLAAGNTGPVNGIRWMLATADVPDTDLAAPVVRKGVLG